MPGYEDTMKANGAEAHRAAGLGRSRFLKVRPGRWGLRTDRWESLLCSWTSNVIAGFCLFSANYCLLLFLIANLFCFFYLVA